MALPVNPLNHIIVDLPVDTNRVLDQVRHLPMGNNAKTIAFFRKPFWHTRVPASFFYLSAPDFTLWEPTLESLNPTLYPLVVYTGGDMARSQSVPATVMEKVLSRLENAFPDIRDAFVTAVPTPHWPSSPYAQGSYTGLGVDPAAVQLFDSDLRPHCHLALAGEALSQHFRGFAEGAIESGLQAAHQIIQLTPLSPRTQPSGARHPSSDALGEIQRAS